MEHGSAYNSTCQVFSDTNFFSIAETSRYYHTYQDPIVRTGNPDVLSKGQVDLLKKTAITVVRNENSQPFPAHFLFRNNHPQYFEDIQLNKGNIMMMSPKNPNGDLRCPIVNNLEGIEFSVGSENLLPRNSPLGDTRLVIPSERLINRFLCNLYFCDLYCHGKGHHVLLAVTRRGSPADISCAQRFPRLPWISSNFENPFLFYDEQNGIFYVTFAIRVSVFYTENARIDESTDFYEHGFGRRTVGYGKPKEESCIICNPSLISRSELKFCFENNCLICSRINHIGPIESTANGETFVCLSNASCKIRNLVYAIECGVCGIQYVGQTQRTLRQRIFEHINDINNGRPTSLTEHINGHGVWNDVPNFLCWVLEIIHQLPENNYDLALVLRRTKESQWIAKLGTAWPNGLNIRS